MKKFKEFIKEDLFSQVPYSIDRSELFRKISPLKKWLVTSDGLGMMNIIDEIFEEYGYGNQLTGEEIEQFTKGLESLRKTNMSDSYISRRLRDKIPNGIENLKLVRDPEGNWDFLNKLNTNYSALSELLTELIVRGCEFNFEKGKVIYDKVIKDPKDGLMSIQKFLKRLIVLYFIERGEGLNDFRKFTVHIKNMSELGESAELKIMDYLTSKGFEIIYRGGNGDFIDMIFGCDMIIRSDEYGYKTVQVKNRFPGWSSVSYYKIDWIAIAEPELQIWELGTKTLLDV